MPATALDRPPVRHNQTLTADELRAEAASALAESGRTQTSVADELGVTPAAVSRALSEKEDASRFASLLGRIVGALTPYVVTDETTPVFRVTRKASA